LAVFVGEQAHGPDQSGPGGDPSHQRKGILRLGLGRSQGRSDLRQRRGCSRLGCGGRFCSGCSRRTSQWIADQCGESDDPEGIRSSIWSVLSRRNSRRRLESGTGLQTRDSGGTNRPRLQSRLSLPSVYSKTVRQHHKSPGWQKNRRVSIGSSQMTNLLSTATGYSVIYDTIHGTSRKRAERSKSMGVVLDKGRFGPWALVTGASSGIGKEFARQIAASGINIVLVARREALLTEVVVEFSKRYGVEHRAVALDVSRDDFIGQLASATDDLDIGLVVSNAGTGNSGEFLKLDRQLHQATLRVSTMAHLDITHHFGAKLAKRRRGGLILAGAMGAENGVPRMANDGAAKAYVHSLGEALHYEFKPLGVYVTVLAAGFTNTAVLEKFGLEPKTMPMKPMSVEQCVSEGLSGLVKNRSKIVPGRLNRILNALVPASLARKIEADLIGKGLASKSVSVGPSLSLARSTGS